MLGDSILAWHALTGGSAPDEMARLLGQPVESRARSGARFTTAHTRLIANGAEVRSQYDANDGAGARDWVVLNGGANDLLSECGCRRCAATFADLIDSDGQRGAIPDLVDRIRANGAQVLVMGYYFTNPDRPTPFSACRDEIKVLNYRLSRMARTRDGVHFVAASSVIDQNDPSHFYIDSIHPSRLGAARMGRMLARTLSTLGAFVD